MTFTVPADNGSPLTGVEYSVDGGRTWHRLSTTGTTRRTGTIAGLTNGRRYSVEIRGLNHAGAGAPSPAVPITPKTTTPVTRIPPLAVSPAQRRREIPVPAHPAAVRGPVRTTTADGRSQNGTAAFAATGLHGYRLRAHQAVDLSNAALFGYNSDQLTARARVLLREIVVDLRGVSVLTCEGYTDYDVDPAHARRLSTTRARVICLKLRTDGAHIQLRAVGYGGRDPVAVGGTIRQRRHNRRVVLYINR